MRSFLRTISVVALALFAVIVPSAAASAKPAPKAWAAKHHLKGAWRNKDTDRDGLTNLSEFKLKTDPRKADTDRDKLSDGNEVKAGDDPLDRDTDGDGVADGAEHAGVITAFDGNSVTIKQFVGGTLSASLTDDADCSGADDPSADDSSSDDPGDDTTDDGGVDVTWTDGTDTSSDDTGDDTSDADTSSYTDVEYADVTDSVCSDPRFKKGAVVQFADVTRDGGQLWIDTLVLAPGE